MPREPSVTSACEGPRSCTLRYSSALLPNSFARPGPKSVSPAMYCSGVKVVVWWKWIVDIPAPFVLSSPMDRVCLPARPCSRRLRTNRLPCPDDLGAQRLERFDVDLRERRKRLDRVPQDLE